MLNFSLLQPEDIEVKVKQVTKTGALLLLYKTARVDAKILDETVGPMNWTCNYEEIHGNLFCTVGVREDSKSDFVYKCDCGIESEQDDGNEKKAESSDAFKRACSRWGIGRELYSSPQIWAAVATEQKGDKWKLSDPYAKYVVTTFECNPKTRVITKLVIKNAKTDVVVFEWELATEGAIAEKMNKTIGSQTKEETKSTKKAPATESPKEEKPSFKDLVVAVGNMAKNVYSKNKDLSIYQKIVEEESGQKDFKCNKATEDQYDIIVKIHDRLIKEGYGI